MRKMAATAAEARGRPLSHFFLSYVFSVGLLPRVLLRSVFAFSSVLDTFFHPHLICFECGFCLRRRSVFSIEH